MSQETPTVTFYDIGQYAGRGWPTEFRALRDKLDCNTHRRRVFAINPR